ncbi:MAG TPA: hypothetical protein VND70_08650 [Acidimicrobiales bacterium]|nr:hypothetical protein [Acidimicrobiales bacterium]
MNLLGSSETVAETDTSEVPIVPNLPPPPAAGGAPEGNGTVPTGATPLSTRLERLAAAIDRSRRGRSDRDIRKIMQLIGMAVIGFGLACIVLGWYGAAHSPFLYQEVPYLISGGLLGVALVFGGGVLVRCAWSLRQIEEARRNAGAIVRSVERLESALRALQADPDADQFDAQMLHDEVRP